MMRRALVFVVGVIVFAVAAGWLVLQSPFFNGARQAYVAHLLTAVTGQPITISGRVTASPGRLVGVTVETLSIPNAAWADRANLIEVGHVSIDFPICVLWGCVFEVSHWRVRDAVANFEVSASGAPSWQTNDDGESHDAPRLLPVEIFFAAESIENMTFRYRDHASQWFTVVSIDTFEQDYLDGTRFGDRTVAASGHINGIPYTYHSQTVVGADPDAPYALSITFHSKGFVAEADGTAAVWNFGRDLDVAVSADIPSLAGTLSALNFAPVVDGTGTFHAEFKGNFDALAAPAFTLEVHSSQGTHLSVDGSVDRLWGLKGFDVGFVATESETPDQTDAAKTLSELRLTGVSGDFVGDLDQFSLRNLRLQTNAFDQSVRTVGPISIENFARSDDGLLVLPHYAITLGPHERPWLTLNGRIGNVLALKDVEMSGTFDVPPEAILSDLPDPSALGDMTGTFRFAPDGERTRLEALDVAIVGSDIVSAKVSLAEGEAPGHRALTVEMLVDDYLALAQAFGAAPVRASHIVFNAEVDLEDTGAHGLFRFQLDDSEAVGKLELGESDGRDAVSGVISLPRIEIEDITQMIRVGRSVARYLVTNKLTSPTSDALPALIAGSVDAHLTVLSDDLVAEGETVRDLRAEVAFTRGLLRIDPLSLGLLDGTFEAGLRTNVAQRGDPLHLRGSMNNVQLGLLFPEALVGVAVSGNLSGDYQLSAIPDSFEALISSLTGTLSIALNNGRIGSTALDMAGLGPLKFMFSKASRRDFSSIRCAVGDIRFTDGRAEVDDGALETEFIHASINGTFDVPHDTIDMLIEPRPLDDPAALPYIPTQVTGKLTSPDVTPLPGEYRLPKDERTPVTAEDEKRAKARATACERVENPS